MGQVLHGSATKTEAIRRAIQNSQESLRALSKRYGINQKTVAKWKKRTSVADLATGPKEPKSTVLSSEEEAAVLTDCHWLTGVVYDAQGRRLTPVHATKAGKRYRYYVSDIRDLNRSGKSDRLRLNASTLEAVVDSVWQRALTDDSVTSRWMQTQLPEADLAAGLQAFHRLAGKTTGDRNSAPSAMQGIRKVVVAANPISIDIDVAAVMWMVREETGGLKKNTTAGHRKRGQTPAETIMTITHLMALRKRGIESRIVIDAAPSSRPAAIDATMVDALGRAHLYLRALTDGSAASIADVAKAHGVDASNVSRLLPLAYLAPEMTTRILSGRQPVDLTLRKLVRSTELPIL